MLSPTSNCLVLDVAMLCLFHQMDELLKKLCKWFEDCNTREAVNSVTYVCDVWLPEVIFSF